MVMKFVLSLLLVLSAGCLKAQQIPCSKFKTGKFVLAGENTQQPKYVIERTEEYQFEKDMTNSEVSQFKIEWLSDCEYSLELVRGGKNIPEDMRDKKLFVTITGTQGRSYSYSAKIEGLDMVMTQTLHKID